MTPAAYMNMARGQPCVVPSRLKMTCVDRSAPRRITTGYPRYELNKYREHHGQSTREYQSAAGQLRRLKAFEVSTSNRQSVSRSSNTSRMACTAASMPAFDPAHNWSADQNSCRSMPVARAMALASRRCLHSLIPMGRMPSLLSIAMPRRASRAHMSPHGTTWLASSGFP